MFFLSLDAIGPPGFNWAKAAAGGLHWRILPPTALPVEFSMYPGSGPRYLHPPSPYDWYSQSHGQTSLAVLTLRRIIVLPSFSLSISSSNPRRGIRRRVRCRQPRFSGPPRHTNDRRPHLSLSQQKLSQTGHESTPRMKLLGPIPHCTSIIAPAR